MCPTTRAVSTSKTRGAIYTKWVSYSLSHRYPDWLIQTNVPAQIAARPHPYNSHSNDHVHGYVLARLQAIASQYPHVSVVEDRISNASWAVDRGISKKYGVYFEGTNILVKIDGTEPGSGGDGVLFSAHYDSVSTAPGATDDGMGVSTLIQMVDYLGQRRPKKTAVFNFNNGEEDGLLGAYAFLLHPWSNLTSTFLNLEGASSGGSVPHTPHFTFHNHQITHTNPFQPPHALPRHLQSAAPRLPGAARAAPARVRRVCGRLQDGRDTLLHGLRHLLRSGQDGGARLCILQRQERVSYTGGRDPGRGGRGKGAVGDDGGHARRGERTGQHQPGRQGRARGIF